MKKHRGQQSGGAWIALAAMAAMAAMAALSGCAGSGGAGPPVADLPRYRCNGGMEFTVRFAGDGSAVLKGARGDDVLLRDAGGQGAQTVYSNRRMRAEFGLGAGGREAVLHYPVAPLATRCVRD